MKFFLNFCFSGFFIQSVKIGGIFNLKYLYLLSSFKFNLKVIDIFNLNFSLKKTRLLQTFNNMTQSTDSFFKYIYPQNVLNSYNRLKIFFNFKNILQNMFLVFFKLNFNLNVDVWNIFFLFFKKQIKKFKKIRTFDLIKKIKICSIFLKRNFKTMINIYNKKLKKKLYKKFFLMLKKKKKIFIKKNKFKKSINMQLILKKKYQSLQQIKKILKYILNKNYIYF